MNILLDSDFLFGLFVPDDVHHKNTKRILKKVKGQGATFYALNLVIQETATVVSNKRTQKDATRFVDNLDSVVNTIIVLSPEVEEKTWKLFLEQKEDEISFIDCANLASLEEYNLDKIASFDGFYPEELLLK